MQFELLVNNDLRVLSTVRAFLGEALCQTSLASQQCEKLVELAERSARAAVENAYPAGEEGSIRLAVSESKGKLTVIVRDYGMPQDVEALERQIHGENHFATRLFGMSCQDVADEIHWLGYGPEGKALQITKWLHNEPITDQLPAESLKSFREDVPQAPEQPYMIRRMAVDEAVQVSQLIYRAYGGTYFNRDVYYPDRIAAQNERQIVLSFVADAGDGCLVGHYALERNQEGPVAEGGQAVVDPAHRGRGLLSRMKAAALEEAGRLGLMGLYSDAVTVHTMTQKSDIDHGARLTCVELGISPKTEHFRNISGEQPQRVTCLQYFLWLQPAGPRVVHVPDRHREIVEAIYHELDCPTTFAKPELPKGHGTLIVKIDSGAARAMLCAETIGVDTTAAIRHAKRELVEHSHAEVVFVDLPLNDPATPHVATALERDGFGFAGIAPHFSTRGDLLRMVYLTEPLEREPIKTYGEFAGRLVDYAIAEQSRTRGSLD